PRLVPVLSPLPGVSLRSDRIGDDLLRPTSAPLCGRVRRMSAFKIRNSDDGGRWREKRGREERRGEGWGEREGERGGVVDGRTPRGEAAANTRLPSPPSIHQPAGGAEENEKA